MNISLVSLHILSLHSISPFYTISINNHRRISSLFNSQFSYSFTSIIYSTTNYHSTTINNNKFMKTLSTPLVFISDSLYEGKCADKCCISKDYYFRPDEIIRDINITDKSFPDGYKNLNAYFVDDECGDIKITNCQFIKCFTTEDNGGGIYISEDCLVILHRCIFDRCHSKKNGGAGAIAKQLKFKDDKTSDPEHEETKRLDIQYTCFQGCYTDGDGYGTALILGAKSVTFFYASTIDCPPRNTKTTMKQKGAQFDILSDSISSQFINATGGIAVYCGSLEYRKATKGFFRYQTITCLECKYAMSFTSVNISGLSINSCNVFNNTINMVDGEDIQSYSPPALIFVRNNDLLVDNFYFSHNNFCKEAKLASREMSNDLEIKLINCFIDTDNTEFWNLDYLKLENFKFSDKEIETFPLRQLSLGLCQGDVAPGNMVITSLFTASSAFSPSDSYTHSSYFTKSDNFVSTNLFSSSCNFSNSNSFTNLNPVDKGVSNSNKDNKKTVIGASIGAVGGAAVIAAVVAFFLIRKRQNLLGDSADMLEETNGSVTIDNGPFYYI